MINCNLCKLEKEPKKNTHYLTDNIIRRNLNQDGSNIRETGLYFNISNDSPFIEFLFQRETSIERVEKILGRQATEEEIAKAKQNPFSTDDKFCQECENKFTTIENKFTQDVLPHLRGQLQNGLSEKEFDSKIVRDFILIQVFRTAVCEPEYEIAEETQELIRLYINGDEVEYNSIHEIPLGMTFLETSGEFKIHTQNVTGLSDDRNPNFIFMNDFILQYYDNEDSIKFESLHGLNSEETYVDFINISENSFKVKILDNAERLTFLEEFVTSEKINPSLAEFRESFKESWIGLTGQNPNSEIVDQFIAFLINGNKYNVLLFSREEVVKRAAFFLINKLGIKF